LSFLLDSLQRPSTNNGSAADLFRKYIASHNEQVEAEKQFAVGEVTVESADTLEDTSTSYTNTFNAMENLVDLFGGYMRTRTVDDAHYIDYVKEYGRTNSQGISFGANLLDLTEYITAEDLFTVLIPVGYDANGNEIGITSVNGGLDYIYDADAVALFGKITRAVEFPDTNDPDTLLEKARAYLADGIALATTLTIQAIDLHLLDIQTDQIKLGDTIHVTSLPHNVDRDFICTKIEYNLQDPSQTIYTLGLPPRTMTETTLDGNRIIENIFYANLKRQTGKFRDEITGLESSFDVTAGAIRAEMTDMENGFDSKLTQTASSLRTEVNDQVNGLNSQIDQLAGEISLKASKESVDKLGDSVEASSSQIELIAGLIQMEAQADGTTVAVRLDAAEDSIELKANKSYVDGLVAKYIETDNLAAVIAAITVLTVKALQVNGSLTVSSNATFQGDLGVSGDLTMAGTLTAPTVKAYTLDLSNALTIADGGTGATTAAAARTNLGLGNVENKSSETIRGELTKANVTDALGYTPPTANDITTGVTEGVREALGNYYTKEEVDAEIGEAEFGGNAYTLPAATSSTLGGVITGSNITNSGGTISLTKANVTSALGYTPPTTNTTYSAATTSAAGLMTAAMVTKLNGIAAGANAYTLPAATSSTLGGVKTGSNITNSSGTISLTKANVTSALGYTPPTANDITTGVTNALGNYYTKSQVDAAISSAINSLMNTYAAHKHTITVAGIGTGTTSTPV